ncbi:MAG: tRNA 4-thiouridine(8) synthase ThiI [Acidobacteriia bacterium]|nr:tRNA 4-thiouridine(8) synthase ThiI [Terriglobia bacterium]
MNRVLILHYHEIWLKGGNKNYFLSRLIVAVKHALADLPVAGPQFTSERLLLRPQMEEAMPKILERLRRVFGLAYVAVAREVPSDPTAIEAAACEMMAEKNPRTFAVRAKIADPRFPMNSMELERALGRQILDHLRARASGVQVKLKEPEVTCWVEMIPGRTFLYADRVEGAGGLPPVTSGRLVALLSGGFDSAVAAYKMMRRGAHVVFAHFYGPPSISRGSSRPVAEEIARTLTPYQFTTRLYLVPFDEVQRQIVAATHESFRVLLYRRMMARIARQIARAERALGLVTGDSVSQVASQTLHNLAALDRGIDLPIYRPLAGDDKTEILKLARAIGTYKISCEPFEDCCPRFMPRSPAIFARPEQLERAEAALDIEALVTLGLEGATVRDFKFENGEVALREAQPRRLQKLLDLRKGIPRASGARPTTGE